MSPGYQVLSAVLVCVILLTTNANTAKAQSPGVLQSANVVFRATHTTLQPSPTSFTHGQSATATVMPANVALFID